MKTPDDPRVPEALANDNWYGYVHEVIVRWQVRWIEMAVVLPFWTSLVVYYVEGDRGHLLNEQVGAQRSRWAVRGNCFSYNMPWEDILSSLGKAVKDEELQTPLPQEVLVHIVRLNLKIGNEKWADKVKPLKLRAHVVLRLAEVLIDTKHPAYRKSSVSAVELKARFQRLLQERYPDPDGDALPEEEREGLVPAAIAAAAEESLLHHTAGRRPLAKAKHATPDAAPTGLESAFDAARPSRIVGERSSRNIADGNDQRANALGSYGEVKVQTGSRFIQQWNAEYLALAFPFVLSYAVGGPEFPERTDRNRRTDDAVPVPPAPFTRMMANRVESQIASDWTFLGAVRNIQVRHQAAHAELLKTCRTVLPDEPAESRATQLTQAAVSLYQKLNSGTYNNGKRINGDFSKLRYADDLSRVERYLVSQCEHVAKTIPGMHQIRVMMGHSLFGSRTFYGDILFLTISPSERTPRDTDWNCNK